MTLSFGTRLRQQREQREVSLAAIAAETKIKMSLLEALERDDVSHWPVGIFRKAYVRSYAQAIGLDPTTIVREFLDLYPDPTEAPAAPEGEIEPAPAPSPNRLRRLVTSAIAAVPALQHSPRRVSVPAARVTMAREYVVHAEADDWEQPVVDPQDAIASPANGDQRGRDVDESPPGIPIEQMAAREALAVPAADRRSADARLDPSLSDVADLCTRLARVQDRCELGPVLEDAARMLDAVGLIVWSWDARASALRPTLAHGYSDSVLARLPIVGGDADNAIAAAFRSAEACTVHGEGDVSGAAVMPLIGHAGCVGVLALELRRGGEQREPIRAMAAILAAQLVTLLGVEPMADAATA
jgi:transcriptional regulator with XRE-family HTH domain